MDHELLFLINRNWTHPALDRLMTFMSCRTLWAVPLAIVLVVAMIRGGFRPCVFAVLALLSFVLTDRAAHFIKQTTGRLRPHQSESGVRVLNLKSPILRGLFRPIDERFSPGTAFVAEGHSFPSNHASTTTAVALVAALLWRRRGWIVFIPALTVAWSRIYNGAHWPTDVLAGIGLGLSAAMLCFAVAELAWRRFGRRLFPATAARHPSLCSP